MVALLQLFLNILKLVLKMKNVWKFHKHLMMKFLKRSKIGVNDDGSLFWVNDLPTSSIVSDIPSSSHTSFFNPSIPTLLQSNSSKLDRIISNQLAILRRWTALEGNVYAIQFGQESIHSRLINLETKAINFVKQLMKSLTVYMINLDYVEKLWRGGWVELSCSLVRRLNL